MHVGGQSAHRRRRRTGRRATIGSSDQARQGPAHERQISLCITSSGTDARYFARTGRQEVTHCTIRMLPTFGIRGSFGMPGSRNPLGQYTKTALPIMLYRGTVPSW